MSISKLSDAVEVEAVDEVPLGQGDTEEAVAVVLWQEAYTMLVRYQRR